MIQAGRPHSIDFPKLIGDSSLRGSMLSLLLACTALITVNAPTGSRVYVTDYSPSTQDKPKTHEAAGDTKGGSYQCEINYYAWEKYYVWVDGPKYEEPQVYAIPNEIKVEPAVVGMCVAWPALIWAWGPTEDPIDMQPY